MKKPSTFNWNEQDAIYCTAETINNIIDELAEEEKTGNIKKVDFYFARDRHRIFHTYCVSSTKHSVIVRIFYSMSNFHQYIFNENRGTSVSQKVEITGQNAYKFIENLFQEEYGEDQTLFTTFSGRNYQEEFRAIKNCVPKPVSMINGNFTKIVVDKVHKADISSAYPAEGSKALPTLHGCIRKNGRVEPNEEFPFAFYINSHHMAIYNEFSTTEWAKSRRYYTLYDEMFNDYVPEEDDITILCKAAACTLSNVFSEVYAMKLRGNAMAKLGMNAAIGYFEKTGNPTLSHLSAVIKARCCNRIIKLCKKISASDSAVILVATDSICWIGSLLEDAVDNKFLGSFTYEVHSGKFYGVGPKAYQIIDDRGECHTKYSGMKNSDEKNSLKFGEIPDVKGNRRYIINDNGKVEEVNWAI